MFEFLLASDQPFETLNWWMILTVALVHAVGCFIRGAYGFGSNMPIVVATTFIIGPHHAILLALMTTIICQIHLMPSGFKTADWQVAKTLIPGMIIGSLFGTWAFTFLSGISLQIILGILIVGIIVMDTFKLVEKLTNKFEIRSPKITGSFSFISGTMGGLSGAGAFYFLVVYLKHACPTPIALRGTNVMLATVTMSIRVTALAFAGMITPTLITEGLLLSPIVCLATWLGAHAFKVSSSGRFYFTLQVLLILGAVVLIFKGVKEVLVG
ncbi:MAG: hypothetical protein CMM37_10175 [Rhodospirillaceae bacterium]|nr:hypothetical protein [Rhodospirillaceae bacterium]|tara:strand:+ start:246 stop:1052 length:807 start_codon:yes stop_codon:yes gene_type:complete